MPGGQLSLTATFGSKWHVSNITFFDTMSDQIKGCTHRMKSPSTLDLEMADHDIMILY
ncbi:hypothetical protein D3C71_2195300 [compost metagenome]